MSTAKSAALVILALVFVSAGISVAFADDPSLPGIGPAGLGMLLMAIGVFLAVKAVRNRLPAWAARAVLGVGVLAALGAGLLIHVVAIAAPLFAQPPDVPSVVDSAPSPQYAVAVERARELVRAAVLEQKLPGVSVAVGAGVPAGTLAKEGKVVWAEGFGWRDVDTRTLVTPKTRFIIGTAASAITPEAAASLGLTNTGADAAGEWSPEHVGEPEEDFPGFTVIRHLLQRIGLATAQPLPGDRATFYGPRSDRDPRTGRRLMAMRDLACCAGKMASYSTAPDLVRVGLASGGSIDGELAGGTVMSLVTRPDRGIVVAVLSNMSHANTAALAAKIGAAFATPSR